MSAIKLTTKEQLQEAREHLRNDFPYSQIAWSWLNLNIIKPGGIGTPSTNPICYVDRWPKPNAIFTIDRHRAYGMNDFPDLYIYATRQFSDQDLEKFMLEVGRIEGIDKNKQLLINAIDGNRVDLCRKIYGKYKPFDAIPCGFFYLDDAARKDILENPLPAPEGFHLDKLTLEDAEYCNDTWPHKYEGSLKGMQRRITDLANVCVRETSTGRLAAFELTNDLLGLVNHLFTTPEFRRKGLATVVERNLCAEMLKRGEQPMKTVIETNVGGMQMTLSSPWWTRCGEAVWIMCGGNEFDDYRNQNH